MGYYTDFTLTATPHNKVDDDLNDLKTPSFTDSERTRLAIQNEIEKMNVFDDVDFDCCWGNAKWYDHDEDMCLLSKKFPSYLFYLHGEGEESDDLWDAYYLDGKMQFCPAEITYDSFSTNKLTPPREMPEVYSYQK